MELQRRNQRTPCPAIACRGLVLLCALTLAGNGEALCAEDPAAVFLPTTTSHDVSVPPVLLQQKSQDGSEPVGSGFSMGNLLSWFGGERLVASKYAAISESRVRAPIANRPAHSLRPIRMRADLPAVPLNRSVNADWQPEVVPSPAFQPTGRLLQIATTLHESGDFAGRRGTVDPQRVREIVAKHETALLQTMQHLEISAAVACEAYLFDARMNLADMSLKDEKSRDWLRRWARRYQHQADPNPEHAERVLRLVEMVLDRS